MYISDFMVLPTQIQMWWVQMWDTYSSVHKSDFGSFYNQT